jgi:hypothetical protein
MAISGRALDKKVWGEENPFFPNIQDNTYCALAQVEQKKQNKFIRSLNPVALEARPAF